MTAYLLGRLVAALDHLDALPVPAERAYVKAHEPGWIESVLPRILADAKVREAIAPIMEVMEDFPERPLNGPASGEFGLGYYHQRKLLSDGGPITADQRAMGRPANPPGTELRRVPVPLTEDEWEWVKEHVTPDQRRTALLRGRPAL